MFNPQAKLQVVVVSYFESKRAAGASQCYCSYDD